MKKEKQYVVVVSDGKRRSSKYKELLEKMGFSQTGRHTWEKTTNRENSETCRDYFTKKGLSVRLIEKKYTRSSDYRQIFFSHYPPYKDNKYFCIYCGKLVPKNEITVDHIIPVHDARNNKRLQKWMDKKGWDGVNDYRNLGACCRKCNLEKGKKTRTWLVRAYWGKLNRYQVFRRTARILCVILLIVILFAAIIFLKKEGFYGVLSFT